MAALGLAHSAYVCAVQDTESLPCECMRVVLVWREAAEIMLLNRRPLAAAGMPRDKGALQVTRVESGSCCHACSAALPPSASPVEAADGSGSVAMLSPSGLPLKGGILSDSGGALVARGSRCSTTF